MSKDQELAQIKEQMIRGMRNLAAGVSVIAAVNDRGERFAMTATSVTSVSMEPPSLLVCVNKHASISASLNKQKRFTVNLLAQSQCELSQVCASPDMAQQRFNSDAWSVHSPTGLPIVSAALSVFCVDVVNIVTHGTHDVVIGDVKHVLVNDTEAIPLVYFNRAYRGLTPA